MYDLNTGLNKPLYMQIADQTVKMVSEGKLREGDKMPSVRELAADLGINPATVSKAYKTLDERGFIKTEKGLGTYISYSQKSIDNQQKKAAENLRKAAENARDMNIGYEEAEKIIKDIYGEV